MKIIKLINVFGPDRPGVTCGITEIMSRYGITILDIGQSVIHDNLSLAMLLAIAPDVDSAQLFSELEQTVSDMGLGFRSGEIEQTSYQVWVEAQGAPRHFITLLARVITAEHLSALTDIIRDSGLNIDKIDRLSGRISLDRKIEKNKACVEFSVRGALSNAQDFRERLVGLSAAMDVDIAYQEDSIYRRNRRLVAFDMDSTLIEAEVIDELAKAAGVGEQVAAITEQAMRGELDFAESFRARLALLKGLDKQLLSAIAADLPISEGAEQLITTLKRMGYKTAILSGGFDYFGRYLQSKLGIDYVFANQLAIEGGKLTGEVSGDIVDGQRKAELLRELAVKEGISMEQVIAVGDGANDLPMLSIAGLGIAYRAKPIVRKAAGHSISTLGLDGILYLLGLSDRHTQ